MAMAASSRPWRLALLMALQAANGIDPRTDVDAWENILMVQRLENQYLVGRRRFTPGRTRVYHAEFQLSKLRYDEPLSNFAFKFNLRSYNVGLRTGVLDQAGPHTRFRFESNVSRRTSGSRGQYALSAQLPVVTALIFCLQPLHFSQLITLNVVNNSKELKLSYYRNGVRPCD